MACGDCRDDEALRTAWKVFCERLQEAGERVAQLADALPADTARVLPEGRLRQMRERFDGIRQRYTL